MPQNKSIKIIAISALTQNWVGGTRHGNAVFVPPPPDRVSAIRTEGDWEGWVAFFLEAVAVATGEAERNIVALASLVNADRRRLLASPKAGPASYRLFEMLPMMPRFTIEQVRQKLQTTFPTANAAVKVLEDLGIARELTGQKKNRSYSYQPYIDLLTR